MLTPAERQEEQALRRHVSFLNAQLVRQEGEKRVASVQAQLREGEDRLKILTDTLYARHPGLAEKRAATTTTLTDVARFLPPNAVLLEYVVLRVGTAKAEHEEFVLFAVTQAGGNPRLAVYRLKIEAGTLAQKVRQFREACAGRPNTPSERPYKELARELYRQLIAPAKPSLAGKRKLIFCPDGPLWDVPFQALLTSSSVGSNHGALKQASHSEFLWERYEIDYAYSATGLKAVLDARRRPNRPQPRQTMLVMANPDFGTTIKLSDAENRTVFSPSEMSARRLVSRAKGLGPLPYTLIEANAIRSSFRDAVLKTGRSAQVSVVKQTGGNYRYLHFATHAVFNDTEPMLSGMVFAQPPDGSSESGILTVRELFDLNLAADLVVFSACETGRGAKRRGEGLIGLTWASFVAGVPAQVVSQWSVDDEATARLMGDFYRGLKQGRPKDKALQDAALSLMHDGRHNHPFYWAPFLVIGDWR